MRLIRSLRKFAVATALGGLTALAPTVASAAEAQTRSERKVLQVPMRTDGPRSLDPARGSTTYDAMGASQFYETLLTNKYTNPASSSRCCWPRCRPRPMRARPGGSA